MSKGPKSPHSKPRGETEIVRYKPPFPFFVIWLTLTYEKWHTMLLALMNLFIWCVLGWIVIYNHDAPLTIIIMAAWLSGHLFVELCSELHFIYNLYQSEKEDYLDRE